MKMKHTLGMVAALLFSCVHGQGSYIPFDDWDHGRVALENVSIAFRFAGQGPPVLLVHGNPQHSLGWYAIGPILAQNYTVIAPDNRGMGDSSIPRDNDYSSVSVAADLAGLLRYLNITQVHVLAHDKGVGPATALAVEVPGLVRSLALAEYALPGLGGYEAWSTPDPSWDLYSNWQLAFFSVPDAAEFFINGRVKEMLAWYFFHSSYSGINSVSEDHLNRYTTSISRPGFLRSMLTYFGPAVWKDQIYFNQTFLVDKKVLNISVLVLGGEASLGLADSKFVLDAFKPVSTNASYELVPKAGHWIADENPKWVARRVLSLFGETPNLPPPDLSIYTSDEITYPQQIALGGTAG